MHLSSSLWHFQPFLYRSLSLITQISAGCASSQPSHSLLLVTCLCRQIQSSGLMHNFSPFQEGSDPLSSTSFGWLAPFSANKRQEASWRESQKERRDKKKHSGPQICFHLVLSPLGRYLPQFRVMALDLRVGSCGSLKSLIV